MLANRLFSSLFSIATTCDKKRAYSVENVYDPFFHGHNISC